MLVLLRPSACSGGHSTDSNRFFLRVLLVVMTTLGAISLVGRFVLVFGLNPYESLRLLRNQPWYKCKGFVVHLLRGGAIAGGEDIRSPPGFFTRLAGRSRRKTP